MFDHNIYKQMLFYYWHRNVVWFHPLDLNFVWWLLLWRLLLLLLSLPPLQLLHYTKCISMNFGSLLDSVCIPNILPWNHYLHGPFCVYANHFAHGIDAGKYHMRMVFHLKYNDNNNDKNKRREKEKKIENDLDLIWERKKPKPINGQRCRYLYGSSCDVSDCSCSIACCGKYHMCGAFVRRTMNCCLKVRW